MVDDSYDCLRGEDVRELLEACGATRYIYPTEAVANLSESEKYDLRRDAGCADATFELPLDDYSLSGLDPLLRQLPTLDISTRARKAELLWEALIELVDRRGQRLFSGTYRWQYYFVRSASFDSYFIRKLNEVAWIPDSTGELRPPSFFLFESLGWRSNSFLQSKIRFKRPIVEELAREVGIEPAVLDLLRTLGLTSMTELIAHLNVGEPTKGTSGEQTTGSEETYSKDHDDGSESAADHDENTGEDDADDGDRPQDSRAEEASKRDGAAAASGKGAAREQRSSAQSRFVSYVATHPDGDDEESFDGLTHAERLAVEQRAISLIRAREPPLQVMPAGNKGFDMIETDAAGEPERWIEVKAMAGSLDDTW
jgi:hypothetical protein